LGDILSGTYSTYIGDRQSLKFPVMSDAYIKLPYLKNLADTNTPYGLWEHTGSFTFEAIVTPYDINGYGIRHNGSSSAEGVLTSEKTIPSLAEEDVLGGIVTAQDQVYLPHANRFNWGGSGNQHKMSLFYSDNLHIYLENNTLHNQNQPAEYKLCAEVKLTNPVTLKSNNSIQSTKSLYDITDTSKIYKNQQYVAYDSTLTVSGTTQGTNQITFATSADPRTIIHKYQEIYDCKGVLIGTVTSTSASNFIVDTTITAYTKAIYDALSITNKIYLASPKEALYIENTFHVGVSYEDASGEIKLFLNGVEVASQLHSDRTSITEPFSFGTNDMYIGQNASATYPENRKTQFMGELHELSIIAIPKYSFSSLYTLLPQQRNLLLYLTFEEEI